MAQKDDMKRLQAWVNKEKVRIDNKDLMVLIKYLPKMMMECTFSKAAKVIYETAEYKDRTLKEALTRFLPKGDEE